MGQLAHCSFLLRARKWQFKEGATMTTPRVTETVPDSIRARHEGKTEHDVQRDRVRASFLCVPAEPTSRQPQEKPALFNRIASR
jgi:hypothetical protein